MMDQQQQHQQQQQHHQQQQHQQQQQQHHQQQQGQEVPVPPRRDSIEDSDHRRWVISALETILRSFIFATLFGSILVLVLSKQEKPHKSPIRSYVAGYLSGCVVYFAILLFRVCFVGGYPLIGRQGIAVRCFSVILACFFISWVVAGCVWVSTARSIRSDIPQLYWTSVVLIFSSGVNGGLILTITWKGKW